ncbi:MAG TPA: glycosyltransferase family 2 protein [Flavobacteriales bacterium]|nr:glycosyltransferase family 2 protein [Flavobacteriales bacterium]
MRVLFLADFFSEQLQGGGESNDKNLIDYLVCEGIPVTKQNTQGAKLSDIKLYDKIIVGNFVLLSEEYKDALAHAGNYIIYEHDHKYVATRDPSKFPNFKIPSSQIVNKKFYESAECVVVLSKICEKILKQSIPACNVHNIGCSLWSKERLDFIESLLDQEKKPKDKFMIVDSPNPVKGTAAAIKYCSHQNIPYDLVEPCAAEELLEKIASYKGLVFLPQVLETFSRIAMETKMLGGRLITKKGLLGLASEENLFEMSGPTAVNEIRERNKAAREFFKDALESRVAIKKDITVILNCYRRPEYLKEQIEAVRNQTVPAEQIWVWVNHHEDNADFDFESLNVDRVIRNDYNWKFYGRFAIAMLARTKYIALFDDDTIPGSQWLENCLQTMNTHQGILVGNGISLTTNQYVGRELVGWTTSNAETIEVDLGGHAWLFKQEWLKYLWMEPPYMLENGEDIQFSYLAQKYGDIRTYCPPHPPGNKNLFSSLKGYIYGVDTKATSRPQNHTQFYDERNRCVKNALKNGWILVKERGLKNDLE